MDSTSDDRIRNNTVRHQYRILSDEEKSQVLKIKDLGLSILAYIESLPGNSRELRIAIEKIEEAVMWAVKHVTK